MLRVTSNSFADTYVNQLSSLEAEEQQLEDQAASGLQFTQLSDNPAGMDQVLNLQDQSSQNSQFEQNITALQQTSTASYSAMQGLQSVAQQASEIATLASNGTDSAQQLSTYATQVSQLIQQAVGLMNSQNGGQYLFGGTVASQPPYVMTTNANGTVTSVTYQGNSSVPSIEISPGNAIAVQVPGANTTGSGPTGLITDSRTGADFFNHLISLQNNLLAGNTSAIGSSDVPALAKDEDNIELQVSTNGVIQSQLNDASSLATSQSTSLDQLMSQDDSTDLATTMTQLSQTQNAFQAALESGAMLFQQNNSLLYYLE